jgi:hypothetical protein
MSIYYNNKQKKVGIAKELMNITIFCKEDGDILATNCEEGMVQFGMVLEFYP